MVTSSARSLRSSPATKSEIAGSGPHLAVNITIRQGPHRRTRLTRHPAVLPTRAPVRAGVKRVRHAASSIPVRRTPTTKGPWTGSRAGGRCGGCTPGHDGCRARHDGTHVDRSDPRADRCRCSGPGIARWWTQRCGRPRSSSRRSCRLVVARSRRRRGHGRGASGRGHRHRSCVECPVS